MARATARVLIVPHLPRYAVVMAGGAGTRFWPRSRVHTPKQLLALRGGRSLLQETVARVSPPIRRERVLVVTARPHARAVARQLPRRGRSALLVEPEGRNTAAAIALAALHVARQAPEAVLAVLPADHVIDDLPAFRRDLRLARGDERPRARRRLPPPACGLDRPRRPRARRARGGRARALPLERRGELGGGRGALVGRERAQRAPRAHRLHRQPRLPGRQPRAAGGRARGGRPGGGRYPRRGARLPQGPRAGRAPGGGRAPSPGLEALPLMAETVGSARLAPLAPPSLRPVAAQRSTMLERFGVLARLLVHLLFRQVRVRAEAVEHLRQLARQGTLIYVMRYRSALDYLLVNAVLLREGLPLARFAPGVSTVAFRPLGELLGWLFRRRRRAGGGHVACSALVARGESVLLFMRSQAVAGRRRRALAAARLGPQYLRDVVRVAPAAGRPVFLVHVAILRGKGIRRQAA